MNYRLNVHVFFEVNQTILILIGKRDIVHENNTKVAILTCFGKKHGTNN